VGDAAKDTAQQKVEVAALGTKPAAGWSRRGASRRSLHASSRASRARKTPRRKLTRATIARTSRSKASRGRVDIEFRNELQKETRCGVRILLRGLTRPGIPPKWAMPPYLCAHFGRTTPKVVERLDAQTPGHRDVSQTLLGVLRAEMSSQKSKAKAHLAAPTAELLAQERALPGLYLYDIRPPSTCAPTKTGTSRRKSPTRRAKPTLSATPVRWRWGCTTCSPPPPTISRTRARDPRAGHEGLPRSPEAPREELSGDSFFKHDALSVQHDTAFTLGNRAAVFSGLGQAARVAIGYRTDARLFPAASSGAASACASGTSTCSIS